MGRCAQRWGPGVESIRDTEVWSIWTRWDLAGWAFVLYVGKREPSQLLARQAAAQGFKPQVGV